MAKASKRITGGKNKLVSMQDILFKSLECLSDANKLKENPAVEIKRCTTIAKISSTFINSVRTNMEIMKLADKYSMTAEELSDNLGISIEK